MMSRIVAVALTLLGAADYAHSLKASDADIHRAVTQCPRAQFKGKSSLVDANIVLNKHLTERPGLTSRACENFNVKELQDLSSALFGDADPTLLEVYAEAKDNRRQIYANVSAMQADFDKLNSAISGRDDLHDLLRDGLCHRVVMWFVHHLPAKKQEALAATRGFVLPQLPLADHSGIQHSNRKASSSMNDDEATTAVQKAYDASITCQKCHVGGIPNLGVPEVKPVTAKQLARRCYTNYKELFNISCGPCDGIAGKYWGDDTDKYFAADPCTVIGTPETVPVADRVAAVFPEQFSVDVVAGSDRWGRTTNPKGAAKTPFPPIIDSMYGQISGKWFVDITADSDLWLLRHDTKYQHVHFNGTWTPFSFGVSEIHSQTKLQQSQNNTGPMVSITDGIPSFIPGGCTCVADPVGVPDVHHLRTDGLNPEDGEMQFLGRINLTLSEYDGRSVVVDHWANWFFHVFMDVDKSVPNYGKSPRRLASAFAGTAVYDNWKFADPKLDDPTVWHRGIPTKPERVGPDAGKYCLNAQKIPMCSNISQATFPPKPEAARKATKETPWHVIHSTFMPNFDKCQHAFSDAVSNGLLSTYV